MNVPPPSEPPRRTRPRPPRPSCHAPSAKHRERDFGVGYGNSSGYASNRRYATDWVQPLFRCA